MRDVLALFAHVAFTLFRFCRPGGVRAVMAESVLLRHQLLIVNRGRQRAPNLRPLDRVIAGACAVFIRPGRVLRTAIVLKPSTILACHRALVRWKYRWLFTPKRRGRPGPRGPSAELVAAIVEMKRRNPRWGCPRITQQIALAFRVEIDKDVVRRVLARHYRPESGGGGPSWLTFLGNLKDSLWSVDLFRCESLTLRSHWVLLVMDQYTRRIVGCGVHGGVLDGVAVCRMFNSAIAGQALPRHLSTDHDPLFEFHRWRANLRVLDVEEIKTVPYVPLSHPFVERLIGTLRREYLDQVPFWRAADLRRKLAEFQAFYNTHRAHTALGGRTPAQKAGAPASAAISLQHFAWQSHCRGLFQTPAAG
ncbi:MAG: integrase core domain-containing protein [Bryobacterales bacterium]|nr:integrase core domain-containing protein [Bryobacterales bacterium]